MKRLLVENRREGQKMRQKLKVNNDALKGKLAELYRRAAGFGPLQNGTGNRSLMEL